MKHSTHWCGPVSVAALVLFLQAGHEGQAQEAAVASFPTNNSPRTIEALVVEALENNPELKFYEVEIRAAKAGRKFAASLANPELSGSVGRKTLHGNGLSAEGVAWSVSVVQPFEWPGRIALRKAIANQDLELAELGSERFKASLAGRIRTLAFNLFATQEKSAAAMEVAERFRDLREVLIQRDPAGLTPLLETRVIEATELNAQRKASAAALASQAAMLELNQLRGSAPDAPLVVQQPQLMFPTVPDREMLRSCARTNNFELRARAVELAQQGFRVSLAKNERYPTLSVGPSLSEERAGERERVIGVGISLPLPLWNRNQANIQSAISRHAQAEISLAVAERDIQRQALEASLTYEIKRKEMEKWRPDSVQHFREAAELADRHYRLGAVPISTYVELQKQYLEAVEGLLDTKKEALEAAMRLESLTGLPLMVLGTPRTEGIR
ncbi:MAG: TolC family protein [Verrucomicrobiales bacterium]|nr:TolC family protein [Verrucomicrobiales bacterium]